jgi:hypothetical protein
MNQIKQNLVLAILIAVGSTGCVFHKFNPYVGEQRNWQTAPGSICETIDGMEVFRGFPPKPYELIGELRLRAAPVRNVLKAAVKDARARGADAIIVQESGRVLAGVIVGNGFVTPVHQKVAEVTLLRYKKS